MPNQCKDGDQLDAGLCYKDCEANYTGVGPVCWGTCPPEYNDIGALCSIPPSSYYQCPWYDVCGLTFAKGCLGQCADGYEMVLCSCYRPGKTIPKPSYDRGMGVVPHCSPNLSESGGLCYEFCKEDYIGSGPVCWQNETGNVDFPVQCGPFAFGHTQADCDDLNKVLKQAGLTTPICIAELAIYIATGQYIGPKVCKDLIMKVIPELAKTTVCT